ncbi:MAG TPA: prolyl aminopeptidase [bacterium]|nr:prolyl aminopeptidase [bacterium]
MTPLFPEIEPYDRDMLDAGDGHRLYWETCGQRAGKPALVLHGGPGSGSTPWHRRLFDPAVYRVVLFDQRGCGRSTPHAGDPTANLTTNTTAHLLGDIERLRRHLGVDRWLVLGGSWGGTLALAYAERHPDRVSEIILFGVTTGRHREFDWWFRGGAAVLFPAEWERLRAGVPADRHDRDIVDAYAQLLNDPDPAVHRKAAVDWCTWESTGLDWPPQARLAPRFTDLRYALAFARLVTHYVRHNAWLEDGALVRGAGALGGIPGVLIQGRLDLGAPIAWAWDLSRVWPRAELVVVPEAGHAGDHPGISGELVRATTQFSKAR